MSIYDDLVKKKDSNPSITQPAINIGTTYDDLKSYAPTLEQITQKPEKKNPLSKVKSIFSNVLNSTSKFAARTGVQATQLYADTVDFSADFLSNVVENQVRGSKLRALNPISILGNKNRDVMADKWKSFYKNNVGNQTEAFKELSNNLSNLEYIKPSEDWSKLSWEKRFSPKHLPETVLLTGPGILASLGGYVIYPPLGFTLSVGATANQVNEIAQKSGMKENKALSVALGTGLLVSYLDSVVPEEVLNQKEKEVFTSALAKRILVTGLKEAGTEASQESIQVAVEATLRDDLKMDEVKERLIMSAFSGFLGGSTMQGVVGFMNSLKNGDIGGLEKEDINVIDSIEKELVVSTVEEEKPVEEKQIENNLTEKAEKRVDLQARPKGGTQGIMEAQKAKDIDSLIQEARKYKSAEEFVKAQGTPVYHQSQSKVPFTEFKQKGDTGYKKAYYSQANYGIYFSPSKELVTSKYGRDGGVVIESIVMPKKKLDLGEYDAMYFDGRKVNSGEIVVENFKRSQRGVPELKEPDILLTGISKKAKNWLEKNGYDAVEGMKGEMWSAPELVVLDKNIIKTKSQLIDIYNQAKREKQVKKDIPEETEISKKEVEVRKKIDDLSVNIQSISKRIEESIVKAESSAILAQQMRSNLNINDINRLKRIYGRSKKFKEGDIETIRSSRHRSLLNNIIENIQEFNPQLSEQEALDFALNLPNKEAELGRNKEKIDLEREQKKLKEELSVLEKQKNDLDIVSNEKLYKEWQKALDLEEKLSKLLKVPSFRLPVGEGKEKISRLQARLKGVLDSATDEDIEELGLATYKQMNQEDQIQKAIEFVQKNKTEALKIVNGEKNPPKGLLVNSIYAALVELGTDDTDLATKVSSLTSTRFGQEINILKKIMADNPVVMMQDIVQARIESYEKRTGIKASDRIKREVKNIKSEVVVPTKNDWDSFLEKIKC